MAHYTPTIGPDTPTAELEQLRTTHPDRWVRRRAASILHKRAGIGNRS